MYIEIFFYMSDTFNNISQRLGKFIVYKKMSFNAFGRSVGFSNGLVGRIVNKNNSFSVSRAETILSTYRDLNPQWFLLGEGEMVVKDYSTRYDSKNIVNEPKINYDTDSIKELRDRIAFLEAQNDAFLKVIERLGKKSKQ